MPCRPDGFVAGMAHCRGSRQSHKLDYDNRQPLAGSRSFVQSHRQHVGSKMKRSFVLLLCSAVIGVLTFSAPVAAKTTKECQSEWRADKAANQAKGITEKAYVAKCRSAENAMKPKAEKSSAKEKMTKETKTKKAETKKEESKKSAGKEKSVKACQAEWRANKKANQAKGVTEKAYVEQCRSGSAMTAPTTMPSSASSTKMEKSTSKPHEKMSSTPGMGKPTGADQYATESQAKSHCSRGTVVWVNLESKIYHFSGGKVYGHTKSGAYMCESEAMKQGMRAAKNEKHP
jgi:hypothetical protein